ncbi:MAG: hypothetical protein N4A74_13990 [Carboxylicivirga sp.]|jgi:hypothetical protein|nr:hypothetical protein [Carboxylicivirga sp.]
MIKIKRILTKSQETLEADLILTDKEFELLCYAHPFNGSIGDCINDKIFVFEASNVVREDNVRYRIIKQGDYYEYQLTTLLISKDKGKLKLGDFQLEIDINCLPGDVQDSDYISFVCQRLDL